MRRQNVFFHVEGINQEELCRVLVGLGCRVYPSTYGGIDIKWPFYDGQDYPRAHLSVWESSEQYWCFSGHIDRIPSPHGQTEPRAIFEEKKKRYPDRNFLVNEGLGRIAKILVKAFEVSGYRCDFGP
jgi:hypothetical protein